jgi:signal transduction histidine kinase
LILFIVLVGFIPHAIGLLVALWRGTAEIREVHGTSFASLATETSRKLDLVLADDFALNSQISTDIQIIDTLERRRDELQQQPNPDTLAAARALEAAWDAKDPTVVSRITQGPSATLLQRYFAGTTDPGHPIPVATRTATRALFITDLSGKLVASINTNIAYSHQQTAWWKGALHNGLGQPYIENVAFDERLQSYTFTLSLPIMDRIGYGVIGVLHRAYDAKEYFGPSVAPIRFGRTGHVMLIDSLGTVLSCPILPTGIKLADAQLIPLVTPTLPGWVHAPSDGHGGTTSSIIGFAPLPETSRVTHASTGTNWHTFVWQSSEELFAPVDHLVGWISALTLLGVALLGAFGYLAANRIVTPIRRLQEAARQIGRGELTQPVLIETHDEIEDLADELNSMNRQLEASFAGLTDQVQLKTKEVQYLRQMTDHILDSLSTPVFLLDHQCTVQYLNHAAKTAFWVPGTEPVGQHLFGLLPTMDNQAQTRLRNGLQQAALLSEDGPSDSAPSLKPLKDPLAPELDAPHAGDARELTIGPMRYRFDTFLVQGRSGQETQLGLILRDATEESRLQDQLVHAEKLASLGVLSAGIGHELNNPLFGLLGLSEALEHEQDPDKIKTYARSILGHGKRMASIIKDFTGLTHAQQIGPLESLDLNVELAHAMTLALSTCPNQQVEIRRDYRALSPVQGRSDELRQAFLHILTNSLQAMHSGGTLAISTDERDGKVEVCIRDTGPGIPKAYVNRVFDPFFTTKRQGDGVGLGLTIARRIILKHGGHISVESQPGHGTTMLITFPITTGDRQPVNAG